MLKFLVTLAEQSLVEVIMAEFYPTVNREAFSEKLFRSWVVPDKKCLPFHKFFSCFGATPHVFPLDRINPYDFCN
jgi:hypothetical protein